MGNKRIFNSVMSYVSVFLLICNKLDRLRVLIALKTEFLVTLPGLLGQSCHLSADYFGVSPVGIIPFVLMFFPRKSSHGLGNMTRTSITPSLMDSLG